MASGGYPRFSAAEMSRRRAALAAEMDAAGVEHVVVYGADRAGAGVQWLTQWPVTREAAVLWSPRREGAVLLVQFANHLDNARVIADEVEVRWGGTSTFDTLAALVERRLPAAARLGVIGPLPAAGARRLASAGADLVFLDGAFQRLRLVKSDEELAWVRRGAALTDAAVRAVADGAGVGTSEAQLGALAESAYLGEGATNQIHYFATTSMASPDTRVPAQWPSDRRLAEGDVVTCEVSASWWGYAGQVLRTFTVAAEPSPLYRRLHDVAVAAYEAVASRIAPGVSGADLAEAARVVEAAGFATCDDVVHGYVGGYLPPVVPGTGREAAHGSFVLRAGMTVVVQPNVVTTDGRAGVQTGELLLVTEGGHERLHAFPPGLGRIGP